jgi:hypothetical protein
MDEDSKSVSFGSEIPEGSELQFMYGNLDSLVDGAEIAACTALAKLPKSDQPLLALAISCAGRKLVMGAETSQELEIMLERFPTGSYQLGFYSYGELATAAQGQSCSLHNETMTLMVMYERQ